MGYRTGKITVTNGSNVVIGAGTEWADTKYGVLANTILKAPDGRVYEIESVVNNGHLILHEPYAGPSAENQSYFVITTYIGDMSQFAAQFNSLLEYYRKTQQNMRDVLTGSGNVDVQKDDGTVVPVPALSNTMLKGQFGWGGKAINIGSDVNLFVYFTRDTPAGLYWVNQTGINRPPGFADCVLLWNPIEHQDFYGCLLAIGFTTGGAKTASVNVANGVWENQWTVDWNTRNLNPATANTNQEIHALKTFMANWASLVIKPEAAGQPSYLQGSDFDGSTRWTLGFQNINDDSLLLRNNKIGTTIAIHQDGNVYVGGKDLILTDAKGFVRNARALEYAGGADYGEFLKSQQSAGSAVVGGAWRAFLSVRHRGGNSNKEPGADSTQWGYALVDNNMTQGNFNEFVLEKTINGTWLPAVYLKHSGNTVVGSGGALFTASPVIKIFSDGSFETNHDANGVNVERLKEGVYKITGCQGMNSDPAWNGIDGGVKNPVCRNEKALLWNNYEVDEDGSVTVYTFHRVHRDAMTFAQNRLTLDKVPFDSEKGHTPEMEWPDQSPIDVPKGFFIQVRVNMPERINSKLVMASNVYCNTIAPA